MSDLTEYRGLLAEIKTRIQTAQTRAVLAVNAELIRLYWQIGQLLDTRQQSEGWGAGVIPQLAQDLSNELPELKGFSARNLDRMTAFARAYPSLQDFSPQAVANGRRCELALASALGAPCAAAAKSQRRVDTGLVHGPNFGAGLEPQRASDADRKPRARPPRSSHQQLRHPPARAAIRPRATDVERPLHFRLSNAGGELS